MIKKQKIAVLMTCHNRKIKTLDCLNFFYKANIPKNCEFVFFLVDDGSKDGTSIEVKKSFPLVKLIEGNGNLFWNQGMRLAWKTAIEFDEYNLFLLLNDDVILDIDSLEVLFSTYQESLLKFNSETVVVSACRNSENSDVFSYGGRDDNGVLKPNGTLQECKYMNGNLVLIPRAVYSKIGGLSDKYTHGMGDYDYGLRVLENKFKLITTKKYIATCPLNEGIPTWCNPSVSLILRWKSFNSPLGLNIREYKVFRKRFFSENYCFSILKVYIKLLVPKLYLKLSNEKK